MDIFQHHSTTSYDSELEIDHVEVVNAGDILLEFDILLEAASVNLCDNAVELEALHLSHMQLAQRRGRKKERALRIEKGRQQNLCSTQTSITGTSSTAEQILSGPLTCSLYEERRK